MVGVVYIELYECQLADSKILSDLRTKCQSVHYPLGVVLVGTGGPYEYPVHGYDGDRAYPQHPGHGIGPQLPSWLSERERRPVDRTEERLRKYLHRNPPARIPGGRLQRAQHRGHQRCEHNQAAFPPQEGSRPLLLRGSCDVLRGLFREPPLPGPMRVLRASSLASGGAESVS
jgi:hypothetical protein